MKEIFNKNIFCVCVYSKATFNHFCPSPNTLGLLVSLLQCLKKNSWIPLRDLHNALWGVTRWCEKRFEPPLHKGDIPQVWSRGSLSRETLSENTYVHCVKPVPRNEIYTQTITLKNEFLICFMWDFYVIFHVIVGLFQQFFLGVI